MPGPSRSSPDWRTWGCKGTVIADVAAGSHCGFPKLTVGGEGCLDRPEKIKKWK